MDVYISALPFGMEAGLKKKPPKQQGVFKASVGLLCYQSLAPPTEPPILSNTNTGQSGLLNNTGMPQLSCLAAEICTTSSFQNPPSLFHAQDFVCVCVIVKVVLALVLDATHLVLHIRPMHSQLEYNKYTPK